SRAVRALGELAIEGVATTILADLAILQHPDFLSVQHSTKWVEEVLDLSGITAPTPVSGNDEPTPTVRRDTTVEVNGKRFSVSMWIPEDQIGGASPTGSAPRGRRKGSGAQAVAGGGSGQVAVPMQGTIVKVLVA